MIKKFSFAVLVICNVSVFAQSASTFLGPVVSFHNQTASANIYGPGNVKRTSFTRFLGYGLRFQKQFDNAWGFNVGVNYVNRQYNMNIPYDHCYFGDPGKPCTEVLAHLEGFGYKTLEMPVGVNRHLVNARKWSVYLNMTLLTAVDFQSYYGSYPGQRKRETINDINFFSGSLLSGVGFGYTPHDHIKFALEPFFRLVHKQREDEVLLLGYEEENKFTYFDDFGLRLFVAYGF